MFLKDLDLANMVTAGNKFETLYPARDKEIPNQKLVPKEYDEIDSGVALHGAGLLFWRAQFGLIHNTKFVKSPPKTWGELFDRREEFKGHIGMVRPDAGSGGGRAIIYAFLAAAGVDFSKPFSEIQDSPAWKNGLDSLHRVQPRLRAADRVRTAGDVPSVPDRAGLDDLVRAGLFTLERRAGSASADHAFHAARREHHRLLERLSRGAGRGHAGAERPTPTR